MNAALKSESPMALAWRDKIRATLVLNGGYNFVASIIWKQFKRARKNGRGY